MAGQVGTLLSSALYATHIPPRPTNSLKTWLSIPILLYLALVPLWSRSARFSNIYASATLDLLSVILWLTAWAAVASYVSAGKGHGTNANASGCDNFSLGSAAKCKLSEATIILGVITMLLFIATSYFSVQSVMHYRHTGQLPALKLAAGSDFAAQTQDAFSSNIHTADDFDDEGGEGHDPRQGLGIHNRHDEDDEYALLHQAEAEDMTQGYGVQAPAPLHYSRGGHNHSLSEYENSYGGAYGRHSPNPMQEEGYDNPPPQYGR